MGPDVLRAAGSIGAVAACQVPDDRPCRIVTLDYDETDGSPTAGSRSDLKTIPGNLETLGGRSMLIASMILEERHERRVVGVFPAGEERA